jgi:hypothetical protein
MNLNLNSILNCLIVRNKLQESKYKNTSLKINEFFQLSLKNSLIKHSKQYFILDYLNKLQIPLILGNYYYFTKGICHTTNTMDWIDNNLMVKERLTNNESILNNLIKEIKVNEYGTISNENNLRENKITGFCYEKYKKF